MYTQTASALAAAAAACMRIYYFGWAIFLRQLPLRCTPLHPTSVWNGDDDDGQEKKIVIIQHCQTFRVHFQVNCKLKRFIFKEFPVHRSSSSSLCESVRSAYGHRSQKTKWNSRAHTRSQSQRRKSYLKLSEKFVKLEMREEEKHARRCTHSDLPAHQFDGVGATANGLKAKLGRVKTPTFVWFFVFSHLFRAKRENEGKASQLPRCQHPIEPIQNVFLTRNCVTTNASATWTSKTDATMVGDNCRVINS